jgi:hypothetical protein
MEEGAASFRSAREHRAALREAMARVEQALARPAAADDWGTVVSDRLMELQHALDAHATEVEGSDGILADLLQQAPRLSAGVDQMRSDHHQLAGSLTTLLGLAAHLEPHDLRARCLELLADLVRHRQAGADLVYEAFNADIGGQG